MTAKHTKNAKNEDKILNNLTKNVNQELKILLVKSAISANLRENLRELCVEDIFKHRDDRDYTEFHREKVFPVEDFLDP